MDKLKTFSTHGITWYDITLRPINLWSLPMGYYKELDIERQEQDADTRRRILKTLDKNEEVVYNTHIDSEKENICLNNLMIKKKEGNGT